MSDPSHKLGETCSTGLYVIGKSEDFELEKKHVVHCQSQNFEYFCLQNFGSE